MVKLEMIEEIHFVISRVESGGTLRYKYFKSLKNKVAKALTWSATKRFRIGDLAFFYFGQPVMSIVAIGLVHSDPVVETKNVDWRESSNVTYCDYKPVWNLENEWPLSETKKNKKLAKWFATKPYRSTREIPKDVAELILDKVLAVNPKLKAVMEKKGIVCK